MSFWLSSHRFLSLNRALWEIPPPAMWPLCPHSYRTRRTVWSTVPLTREEAKREVKPRPPGLATSTGRAGMAVSFSLKKKKKDQKNQNGLYIYQRGDPAGLFPSHPRLTRTGDDGGHSGTPHTKVGSDQRTMRITTWAWWDTGSRPVWSRKDRRQSV